MPPPIDDNSAEAAPKRKRRLRAAFAADIANFSGRVSVSETRAFGNLSAILKIGREELDRHEGDLIGMPGDGLFALFESAVDAVQCGLAIQQRLNVETNLGGMRLRIGIHVGDVLFEGDMPFGETLNIAARLESLADPGGILISGTVVDAVSARIQATFEDRGVPRLKNIPRRITTFAVHSADRLSDTDLGAPTKTSLDSTMHLGGKPSGENSDAAPPKPAERVSLQEAISAARQEPDPAPPQNNEEPGKPAESPEPERPEPDSSAQTASDTSHQDAAEPPTPASAPTPPAPAPAELPQPTAETEPASFAASDIAQIAEALAVYAGPVAKVMVNRKAKAASSLTELIEALEQQLPSSQEKAAFRSRLQRFLGR